MTFRTEIHPYRHDRAQLVRRLLRHVGRFDEVVAYDGMPTRLPTHEPYDQTVVGRNRCTMERTGFFLWPGRQHRCNQVPDEHDRRLVRAILSAWARRISDRYLDFVATVRIANWPDQVNASRDLTRNAPLGAVSFLYNELSRSELFRDSLDQYSSFNEYYTAVLVWDDFRLHGLQAHVDRTYARELHSMSLALQAAHAWLGNTRRTPGTVYYHTINGRLPG